MHRAQARRCGAIDCGNDSLQWRLWAPLAARVDLVLLHDGREQSIPLQAADAGYFHLEASGIPDGQHYGFRLDGGPTRADPCSLWQPEGPQGPSAVVRPRRFPRTDETWRGTPRGD